MLPPVWRPYIGLNYLQSKRPIWYAGPDLVASTLLNGRPPRIAKAMRMVAEGCQHGLKPTNLRGMVAVNPAKEDFYRNVIEQRILLKPQNRSIADFLKVLANSGSYGLFVEVNTETNTKEKNVRYYSGEKSGAKRTNYVEKPRRSVLSPARSANHIRWPPAVGYA